MMRGDRSREDDNEEEEVEAAEVGGERKLLGCKVNRSSFGN